MAYPDVDPAVVEVLSAALPPALTPEDEEPPEIEVVLWLPAGLVDQVRSGFRVVHVYTVGGSELWPLRTDRVQVDTYAPGRDPAKATAEAAMTALTTGPHSTAEGLLDLVTVEVGPRMVPYPDDVATQFEATYRIDVRDSD